jgi:hypothetical protein
MDRSLVKGFVQGFAALGFGSAFMHASETSLGGELDTLGIRIVFFIAHQASMKMLNIKKSSLLELSVKPRSQNSTEIANQLTKMFSNKPVEEWEKIINQIDIPDEFTSFSALTFTYLTLLCDDSTVDIISLLLMDSMQVPQEVQEFILNEYIHQIRSELGNLSLSNKEFKSLRMKSFGTYIKLGFACIWQEMLFPANILKDPYINYLGATMLKYINKITNSMTDFPIYDKQMQYGDAYPGAERCNAKEPHAKWHLETANGLLDFVFLVDYLGTLPKNRTVQPRPRSENLHP